MTAILCPHCQHPNPVDENYCVECAEILDPTARACRSCGQVRHPRTGSHNRNCDACRAWKRSNDVRLARRAQTVLPGMPPVDPAGRRLR